MIIYSFSVIITADENMLRKYYAMSGFPLKRFFNTSGIRYREMELAKRLPSMSEEEQREAFMIEEQSNE